MKRSYMMYYEAEGKSDNGNTINHTVKITSAHYVIDGEVY